MMKKLGFPILAATFAAAALLAIGCGGKKPPVSTDMGDTPGTVYTPDAPIKIEPDQPVTPPIMDTGIPSLEIAQSNLKDISFDFDSYELLTGQRATLEANANWLSANPSFKVIIEGHCDERGTDEYNLALGDRRANAARSYLQHLGIATERLTTISYGEAYPVDPGHSESAWARNRRAHFGAVAPKSGR